MSTYLKFRSTTNTFKLSDNNYIYNRRNGYKGATYWYCDQKSVCSASIVERSFCSLIRKITDGFWFLQQIVISK